MNDLEKIRAKVQVGITIVLGLFSVFEIATQPEDGSIQKWAIGIIGIIIGYWLK